MRRQMTTARWIPLAALLALTTLPLGSLGALSWLQLIRVALVLAAVVWLARRGTSRALRSLSENPIRATAIPSVRRLRSLRLPHLPSMRCRSGALPAATGIQPRWPKQVLRQAPGDDADGPIFFSLLFVYLVVEFGQVAGGAVSGPVAVGLSALVILAGLAAVGWDARSPRPAEGMPAHRWWNGADAGVLGVLLIAAGLVLVTALTVADSPVRPAQALVPLVAAGAYLLAARFIRFAPRFGSTAALWASAAVLGLALLAGGWRWRSLQALESTAAACTQTGAWPQAAEAYIDLVHLNARSLDLDRYAAPQIIAELISSANLAQGGRAWVAARVLEPWARSPDDWEQVLSLYQSALPAGGGDLEGARDCHRGMAAALVHLQRWDLLAQQGQSVTQTDPEWVDGWVHLCVGLARMRQYDAASAPFRHLLELLAPATRARLSDPGARSVWTVQELLDLLPLTARPVARACALAEITTLLRSAGYTVLYPPQPIGRTGVVAPADLRVLSSGYGQGSSELAVYGNVVTDWAPPPRGYNLTVFHPERGQIEVWHQFDTFGDDAAARRLREWVEQVPAGAIVIGTVYDEASLRLSREGVDALAQLGVGQSLRGRYRWAHALIGVKGTRPGTALEAIDPRRTELSVLAGNLPPELAGLSGPALAEALSNQPRNRPGPLVYLSGTDPGDQVIIVLGSHAEGR